jgi:beta-lactamase regulating signal transducer with metallopeptidase domain/protocatechuate 3,4-dioxygenase beta subunit
MTDAIEASLAMQAIGWALLQSLWQGTLIGTATAVILRGLRRAAPELRYAAACVALAAFAAATAVTASTHLQTLRSTAAGASATRQPDGPAFPPLSGGARFELALAGEPPRHPALRAPTGGQERRSRTSIEAWSIIAVPLWLAGVLALSGRLAAGWLLVERLKRAANRPLPDAWRTRFEIAACRLQVSRPVRFMESAAVGVPTVVGWLRPVILLPGSALTGLSVVQLEAIVAHELAHVRRHDYLVNVVQTAIETLLFYHPATWWLSRQIRIEREHCCDDAAVGMCGDRVTYAQALADLEGLRGDMAFGLAATGGPLLRRVRRLLGVSVAEGDRSATWIVVAALLTILLLNVAGRAEQTAPTGGGTVRGQILDARSGEPIAGAAVELVSVAVGRRFGSIPPTVSGSTDAEGRYELRADHPGPYRLSARAAGHVEARFGQRDPMDEGTRIDLAGDAIVSGLDIPLERAAVVHGRVFDDRGEGLPGVEIELMARRYTPAGMMPVAVGFAQTDEFGAFRVGDLQPGEYFVRGYPSTSVPPPTSDSTLAYAPTYFPRVPELVQAQPILLSAGQELFGVDFALMAVGTHVLAGTLVDPGRDSFPLARVRVTPRVGSSSQGKIVPVFLDGRFRVTNLVPGEYIVMAMEPARAVDWMSAARHVVLDGDVTDLQIVARRGVRIEGRLIRDGGAALPFDPSTIQVGVEQRMQGWPGSAQMIHMMRGQRPRSDGTFSIDGPGGALTLQVSGMPANWTVKAVRLDGLDITDQHVDFGDGVLRRMDVVLTDRVSEIGGRVTDEDGQLSADGTVVVFPEDQSRWPAPSRLVRGVRPGVDGQYVIDDLPPAAYRAVAVQALPRNAWNDPGVLERLWPLSVHVQLGEGETRTLNLRLVRAPDGVGIAR